MILEKVYYSRPATGWEKTPDPLNSYNAENERAFLGILYGQHYGRLEKASKARTLESPRLTIGVG